MVRYADTSVVEPNGTKLKAAAPCGLAVLSSKQLMHITNVTFGNTEWQTQVFGERQAHVRVAVLDLEGAVIVVLELPLRHQRVNVAVGRVDAAVGSAGQVVSGASGQERKRKRMMGEYGAAMRHSTDTASERLSPTQPAV